MKNISFALTRQLKPFLRPYWRSFKLASKPLRRFLLLPLVKLPLSSEKIGPPKGYCKSTRDWVEAHCSASAKGQPAIYKEIFPAHSIQRSAPKTIDPEVHWKFRVEYERQSPADFVVSIPDGRVWGNSGTVITPDDQVLGDVSIEYVDNFPKDLSVFHQWRLHPVQEIKGKVATLSVACGEVYYHWLFDVLPRIELLKQSDISLESIDNFLVNTYQKSLHQETLTALGIPPEKIIESWKFSHIKASELVVPSSPGLPGYPPAWACKMLNTQLKESLLVKKVSSPFDGLERLYISRSGAKDRRILNEDKVLELLSPLGFRSVQLETLTMAEKASMFSSVKVIVAPHGSGLANLIFCNSDVKVIEIFSPLCINVVNWAICNQMGLDYYYLIGEGKKPTSTISEYVEPNQHTVGRANIRVDVKSLAKLLELANI